jgi:transposase-like protein
MTVALVATLPNLAAEANREHDLCLAAALSSVQHAIRAGEALLAAKQLVPRGQWERWVDANCPAASRMSRPYMRIAAYKAMLPDNTHNAADALSFLRGLPAFDGSGPAKHPPEVRAEAVRLVENGFSQREVAQMLGIDKKCVPRWLKSEPRRIGREGNYRRQREGRPTAAEKRERARRVQGGTRTIGPATLAARFRGVAEAQRAGDVDALRGSLVDLAEAATSWAERLDAVR